MKEWITRSILVLVLVAAGLYVWQNHLQNQGKRHLRETQRLQEKQALKAEIAGLARRTDAVTNWQQSLAGHSETRMSPVMTAELQAVWIRQRPILFIGRLEDIAATKTGDYVVRVAYDESWNTYYFPEAPVELNLICPPSIGQEFFDSAVKDTDAFERIVAVVAKISTIETDRRVVDQEGTVENARIGIGRCIAGMYIGEKSL